MLQLLFAIKIASSTLLLVFSIRLQEIAFLARSTAFGTVDNQRSSGVVIARGSICSGRSLWIINVVFSTIDLSLPFGRSGHTHISWYQSFSCPLGNHSFPLLVLVLFIIRKIQKISPTKIIVRRVFRCPITPCAIAIFILVFCLLNFWLHRRVKC